MLLGKATSAVLCFMFAVGLSNDAHGNAGGALVVGPAFFFTSSYAYHCCHNIVCIGGFPLRFDEFATLHAVV